MTARGDWLGLRPHLAWQWRALRSPGSLSLYDAPWSQASAAGVQATPLTPLLVRGLGLWSVLWTFAGPLAVGVYAWIRFVGDMPLPILVRSPVALAFSVALACAFFYIAHRLGVFLIWAPAVAAVSWWLTRTGYVEGPSSPPAPDAQGSASRDAAGRLLVMLFWGLLLLAAFLAWVMWTLRS